jgi:hypothetical protein
MKILIIRTLKSELISIIIKKLKEEFGNPLLCLLTHNNQESLNFFKNKFNKIYIYEENKDFSVRNIKLSTLIKLKKENFDLVVMPRLFNTNLGFLDVTALSFFILPKKVAILPYKENLIYVSNNFFFKFIIIKFFGFFLNILLQLIFWFVLSFYLLMNKLRSLISSNNE